MNWIALILALFAQAERPPGSAVAELFEMGLQAELIERFLPQARAGGALEGDAAACALVARALFDAGREDEALALLDDAPVAKTERVPLELERARFAIARDELERARSLLQAPQGSPTPVRYPELPDAWLLLARVFARSDRLDTAAPLLQRFLELSPLHPEASSAWHLLARAALTRGDGATAGEYLERARFLTDWHATLKIRRLQAREHPDDPLPVFGIGLAWMRVERWNEAAQAFDTLLARFPDHCPAWFQLGEAHRLAGRTDLALGAYARGIACDPADLRPLANRGLLLASLGRTDDARVDLESVADRAEPTDSDFAPVYLSLARLLRAAAEDEPRVQQLYARYRALGGTEEL